MAFHALDFHAINLFCGLRDDTSQVANFCISNAVNVVFHSSTCVNCPEKLCCLSKKGKTLCPLQILPFHPALDP